MKRQPLKSAGEKTTNSFDNAFPLGTLWTMILIPLCIALPIALKPIAAQCVNVSGAMKLFFITAFAPFFLAIAAFGIAIIPMWNRDKKQLSRKPKWLVISFLLLGFFSLTYAGTQYIAITDQKIYISSLFTRKEYSFQAVERVKIYEKEITKRTGGADVKLAFALLLDGRELDIWPGGWLSVKDVYKNIKAINIPVEVDLKNFKRKDHVDEIQKILE
jgi:hypothetical protein